MLTEVLKAKIHRLTVTGADIDYEGSITIDEDLLDAAGLNAYEKVHVADVSNGARFETYIMRGARGSGIICLNGAAARLVSVGDIIIVMCYCLIGQHEIPTFTPRIVHVDQHNKIVHK